MTKTNQPKQQQQKNTPKKSPKTHKKFTINPDILYNAANTSTAALRGFGSQLGAL